MRSSWLFFCVIAIGGLLVGCSSGPETPNATPPVQPDEGVSVKLEPQQEPATIFNAVPEDVSLAFEMTETLAARSPEERRALLERDFMRVTSNYEDELGPANRDVLLEFFVKIGEAPGVFYTEVFQASDGQPTFPLDDAQNPLGIDLRLGYVRSAADFDRATFEQELVNVFRETVGDSNIAVVPMPSGGGSVSTFRLPEGLSLYGGTVGDWYAVTSSVAELTAMEERLNERSGFAESRIYGALSSSSPDDVDGRTFVNLRQLWSVLETGVAFSLKNDPSMPVPIREKIMEAYTKLRFADGFVYETRAGEHEVPFEWGLLPPSDPTNAFRPMWEVTPQPLKAFALAPQNAFVVSASIGGDWQPVITTVLDLLMAVAESNLVTQASFSDAEEFRKYKEKLEAAIADLRGFLVAVGSQGGFTISPGADAESVPVLTSFNDVEVNDPEAFKNDVHLQIEEFVAMANEAAGAPLVQVTRGGGQGATTWKVANTFPFPWLAVHVGLSSEHFFFSTSANALTETIARAKADGDGTSHPLYQRIPPEDREALILATVVDANAAADGTLALQEGMAPLVGMVAGGMEANGLDGDVDFDNPNAQAATQAMREYDAMIFTGNLRGEIIRGKTRFVRSPESGPATKP